MRVDGVWRLNLCLHLLLETVELRLVANQVQSVRHSGSRGVLAAYRVSYMRVRGFSASLSEGVVSVPFAFSEVTQPTRVIMRRDASP